MESLLTPGFLKKGDKIGIFAPARSVSESELVPFSEQMQPFGYELVYGKNLFGRDRQFSGTVKQRLSDFYQLCLDPDVKVIFAARGGYGGAQLLKAMDWELVRDNPKWLIGFSDLTALHAAFGKFMKTIHGVMPFSLVMDDPQDGDSVNRLIELLKGKPITYTTVNHEYNVSGVAEGSIVGGNLSVLYSIAGTPFEPDYENKILFLEDIDEYLYHIDRMILNFELRDIFRKISGLLIGDFSGMHDNEVSFGKNSYEIIAERAVKYNVPSQFGFPAGHKKMNLPLIFGGLSTLRVKEGENSLKMY